MKLTMDYGEIFFGIFPLSEEEKRREAEYIAEKVFAEAAEPYGGSVSVRGSEIEFCFNCDMAEFYEEHAFEKMKRLLAVEFFIFMEAAAEKSEETEPCSEAERLVRQSYMYTNLTPEAVAEKLGVGRAELDRLFAADFGLSVAGYIKKVRLEKSVEMIKAGFTANECAQACGFGSERTLRRAFSAALGMTPKEYIAHCRKNEENQK